MSSKSAQRMSGSSRSSLGSSDNKRSSNKNQGSLKSSYLKEKRNARVKRTISRQRSRDDSTGYSFTDLLVGSLASVAQTFLYPEDVIAQNKENSRANKNAVNSSSETTADMSLDDHYTYDEEETFTASITTNSTGRSLDTRTPPPNLVGSPLDPLAVKRPIPVSSPGSSFDPVFPSSFGEAPIARMRAPPVAAEEPAETKVDKAARHNQDFVADKHRKWRRQIKLQKQRLESKEDDTSLLTTCGPLGGRSSSRSKGSESRSKSSKGHEPVEILAQLIRAPCADMEDVVAGLRSGDDDDNSGVLDEVNNSLIDHDDDESTNYGTSVTGTDSEFTDDRQSDFTGASERQSDYFQSDFTGASEQQSDFTGVSERQSDFTGGSDYTDTSSRMVSPTMSASLRTGSCAIKGVLKASSFGSSSIASPTSRDQEEQRKAEDKNFIKAFIEDLTHDGMLLIWHGPQGDSTAFRRPCGVVAHLQLGTPVDGVYSGPRLEWQKQDGSDGGMVDLFEISSMKTADDEMLEPYKFAITENTFFIMLNNGKHVVFEASSDTEARRFIHGLRWVVARLSFNLVVGNPLVSCELLSVSKGKLSASPQTPMDEALWSKAMNDVTNHLVDKSLMHEV